MATMLSRLTKVEKAVLSEHVGSYDAATLERLGALTKAMMSRGMDVALAKQQALMVLDQQLSAQASVLAFSRLYLASGFVLVAALPLLLIWRTGRSTRASGAQPLGRATANVTEKLVGFRLIVSGGCFGGYDTADTRRRPRPGPRVDPV